MIRKQAGALEVGDVLLSVLSGDPWRVVTSVSWGSDEGVAEVTFDSEPLGDLADYFAGYPVGDYRPITLPRSAFVDVEGVTS